MSHDLRPGTLIHYPYLWRWQHERGETEGRKDRPVCVVLALRDPRDDLTHLVLLAISSQPPGDDQIALEIPEIECRRSGLSDMKRGWITISEYNYDIAERSHYLDINQPFMGRFSKPFVMQLASALAPLFQLAKARIDRVE